VSDVNLAATEPLSLTDRDKADLERMRNPQTAAEHLATVIALQVFREQVAQRTRLVEHYRRALTEDAGLQEYGLKQLPELP
jgi:hypothetical protein